MSINHGGLPNPTPIRSYDQPDMATSFNDSFLHRLNLRRLLHFFVVKEKWEEAAGVIWVLLHRKEFSFVPTDFNFVNSELQDIVTVLNQLGRNPSVKKNVYEIFNFIQKELLIKYSRGEISFAHSRLKVRLGDLDQAFETVNTLSESPLFRHNHFVLFECGIILYQKWFHNATKEIMLDNADGTLWDSEALHNSSNKNASDDHTHDDDDSDSDNDNDDDDVGVRSYLENLFADSSASNLNSNSNKRSSNPLLMNRESAYSREAYAMQPTQKEVEERHITITCKYGLNRRLFPLPIASSMKGKPHFFSFQYDTWQLGKQAESYFIRCLRECPSFFPAITPLLHILLSECDVIAAIELINHSILASNSLELFKIKEELLIALNLQFSKTMFDLYTLMIRHDSNNEEIVLKIISLNKKGFGDEKAIMESIVYHLDCSEGKNVKIWKSLAKSFLNIRKKIMSKKSTLVETHNLKSFLQSIWLQRRTFFDQKYFKDENWKRRPLSKGKMKLLSYKAACALHILSTNNKFSIHVKKHIISSSHPKLTSIIQRHLDKLKNE